MRKVYTYLQGAMTPPYMSFSRRACELTESAGIYATAFGLYCPREQQQLYQRDISVADFPDLEIPLDYSDHSFVVMYTDASNSTRLSGLGAILIDKSSRTRLMSQATVPQSILSRLADEITAPINHLEILAMLCALITFRRELRGRKIYWGVDNNTALSAALYGYTPSQSIKPLVNALHIAMAHLDATSTSSTCRAPLTRPTCLHATPPHGHPTTSKCSPTSS